MIRTLTILCFSMCVAGAAFAASGIDLTLVACPGDPGALGVHQSVDCATTEPLVLLCSFVPAEAVPDLVAFDGILQITVVGDFDVNPFWNFSSGACHQGGLTAAQDRP